MPLMGFRSVVANVVVLALSLLAVLQLPSNRVFGWITRMPNKVGVHSSLSSLSPQSRREFNVATTTAFAGIQTSTTSTTLYAASDAASANANPLISVPTADELVEPNSKKGHVMVVVGGTSGMGLETVKSLATSGATVIATSRKEEKIEETKNQVKEYLEKRNLGDNFKNLHVVQLDLDQLDNVKSFPDRLKNALKNNSDDPKIDVILNVAGVLGIPSRQLTADGFERTLQSNYLGHFVLNAVLKPFFKDDARIIIVSSSLHSYLQVRGNELDLDNINSEKEYGPILSYAMSKTASILFTRELQRRADENGLKWTVNAVHPGIVSTNIARYPLSFDTEWAGKESEGFKKFFQDLVKKGMDVILRTPQQGAATQVYLAVTDNQDKGQYWADLKVQDLEDYAKDPMKAKQLFELSEKMGGVKFDL